MMYRLILTLVLLVALAPMSSLAGQPDKDTQLEEVDKLVERLETADDPVKLWNSLSAEEQDLVILAMTPVEYGESYTVEPVAGGAEGDFSIAAGGCWNGQQYQWAKNIFGAFVYRVWFNHPWCENGSTITEAGTPWRQVSTGYLWSYEGVVQNWTSGGLGQSYWQSFQQVEFAGCFGPFGTGCIVHRYPWANQTGYGNGNYSGTSGY